MRRSDLGEADRIVTLYTPRLGKVSEGEVVIDIGGAGLTEFLTIHLTTGADRAFTVTAFPNNGRVKILAGYEESTL